jgi:hypothetical protein
MVVTTGNYNMYFMKIRHINSFFVGLAAFYDLTKEGGI